MQHVQSARVLLRSSMIRCVLASKSKFIYNIMITPNTRNGSMGQGVVALVGGMAENPYERCRALRQLWDDRQVCDDHRYNSFAQRGPHYLVSKISGGKAHARQSHMGLDRIVQHTAGDRHGECSSALRTHQNFESWVSERPRSAPDPPCSEAERRRRVEQRLAREREAEEKVRTRLKERLARRAHAEAMANPTPRRALTRQRAAREARREQTRATTGCEAAQTADELVEEAYAKPAASGDAASLPPGELPAAPPAAPPSPSPPSPSPSPLPPSPFTASRALTVYGDQARASSEAWSRWQRQFGSGRDPSSRFTGRYVASMGDEGRLERVPAGWSSPGKSRISTPKAQRFFESSLREHSPRNSRAAHTDHWRGGALWPAHQQPLDGRMPWRAATGTAARRTGSRSSGSGWASARSTRPREVHV